MGFRPSAVVAGKGAARADLRPIPVELRPNRAEWRSYLRGKCSDFSGVFANSGRCARRNASNHKGGERYDGGSVRSRTHQSSEGPVNFGSLATSSTRL